MKIIAEREINYLKGTAYFLVTLAALGLLLKAGQVKTETFELIIGQAALLGVLLLICLGRWDELRKDVGKIKLNAPVFIMAGFGLGWAMQGGREIARQYGLAVAPGAGQVKVPELGLYSSDTLVILASIIVLGPLLEEMLFRFVGLGLVRRLFRPGRGAWCLGAWVIITSALFALLHDPEPAGFTAYFLPSLAYSLAYLRHGIAASWLVHSAGNTWVLLS